MESPEISARGPWSRIWTVFLRETSFVADSKRWYFLSKLMKITAFSIDGKDPFAQQLINVKTVIGIQSWGHFGSSQILFTWFQLKCWMISQIRLRTALFQRRIAESYRRQQPIFDSEINSVCLVIGIHSSRHFESPQMIVILTPA